MKNSRQISRKVDFEQRKLLGLNHRYFLVSIISKPEIFHRLATSSEDDPTQPQRLMQINEPEMCGKHTRVVYEYVICIERKGHYGAFELAALLQRLTDEG